MVLQRLKKDGTSLHPILNQTRLTGHLTKWENQTTKTKEFNKQQSKY